MQLSQVRRVLARAEADARKVAVFEALCAATSGRSAQLAEGARATAARLRSCMGDLAAAWLTALPAL